MPTNDLRKALIGNADVFLFAATEDDCTRERERAILTAALDAARPHGCTCAELTLISIDDEGVWARHRLGCRFGDRVAEHRHRGEELALFIERR